MGRSAEGAFEREEKGGVFFFNVRSRDRATRDFEIVGLQQHMTATRHRAHDHNVSLAHDRNASLAHDRRASPCT